ncbi:MAG TPA: adenylyl-sulfate kinase [Bacteroidia bacterium]|nr:adenylyl-sulfate kinase [Bacteroidia bacterium]
MSDIFPVFHKLLGRADRETLLKQKGIVIWMTGLSASGKTTLAIGLEKALHQMGHLCYVLDGDNVRTGINNNLRFSEEDRKENIRRVAEVSKLFVQCGVITINSFVSPTNDLRDMAKTIIGADDFKLVYVNTPIEVCEQRDSKGLYAKARRGEIKDFTGINAPFDTPISPDLEIKTDQHTFEENLKVLVEFVVPRIQWLANEAE